MKTDPHAVTPLHTPRLGAAWRRKRAPLPALPTMSVVQLGRSRIEKLAWIFGFGR